MYLLKFNFILVLNFIFFCFNLITIHYHTQKQRNMRLKPRVNLNQNISTVTEKLQKKKIKLAIQNRPPLLTAQLTGNDEPYWPLCCWAGDQVEILIKVHCELFCRTNLPPCGNTSPKTVPKCTLNPSRPSLRRNLKGVNSRAIILLSLHSADVTEIRFMSLGNDILTLCWFSMSLNCFVKAVNDGLAFDSFCQQFIMI